MKHKDPLDITPRKNCTKKKKHFKTKHGSEIKSPRQQKETRQQFKIINCVSEKKKNQGRHCVTTMDAMGRMKEHHESENHNQGSTSKISKLPKRPLGLKVHFDSLTPKENRGDVHTSVVLAHHKHFDEINEDAQH